MMDRHEPSQLFSFEERLQRYYSHVRYWNHIIDTHKVDCFIGINYPHETYDYVIYSLCKAKGIKTLFFCQTHINGYIQLLEDVELNDTNLILSDEDRKRKYPIKLSEITQKHYDQQTGSYQEPFYMELNRLQMLKDKSLGTKFRNLSSFLSLVIKKILLMKKISYVRWINYSFYKLKFGAKADLQLSKQYDQSAITPNLKESYIYIPLHFQPECTTSPQGNYFVNQELMIEMIHQCIPSTVLLYVKEHPFQRIQGRSISFYEKLAKLPSVVLIKKNFDSKTLIKNSLAVATVTGTAGWESLFQNKRVLLFGAVFYKYAPGVFTVKTNSDCKESINEILNGPNDFSKEALIPYLKKIEEHCIRGWIDEIYSSHSSTSYEVNLENLLSALLKRFSESSN